MSQTEIILNVVPRSSTGKSAARAARRDGQVPAVIYGGKAPPETVNIPRSQILKALAADTLVSRLVSLKLGDRTQIAIASDIQFHPVTDQPMHLDLFRVDKGQQARVEIPVHFIGHDDSPGLKRGGSLNIVRRHVEVLAPVEAVPEELVCDLGGMDIGDNVKMSSLTLPAGVSPTITDRDFTIATMVGRVAEQTDIDPETEEIEETGDEDRAGE